MASLNLVNIQFRQEEEARLLTGMGATSYTKIGLEESDPIIPNILLQYLSIYSLIDM